MSIGFAHVAALASRPVPSQAGALVTQWEHEIRLRSLVLEQGDFVARSLRNLGVVGGELDDCVQSVFLVVARRIAEIERGKEKSFLFACCQNTAAHFRRSLARKREVPDDVLADRPSGEAAPDTLMEQKRTREMLDRLLDSLEDSLRSVFVLHEFEEMTMAQISEVLSIPAGTVASRLRRAREQFRLEFWKSRQRRRESA